MVKKNIKDIHPKTQNYEVHRVNNRAIILCIVAVIMVALACDRSPLWGITTEDRYHNTDLEPNIVIIVGDSEQSTPEQSVSIPESANQPGESQGSEVVTNNVGINEYSVSAQDFSCICRVDGNVNVELRVNGDQLEVVDSNGGVQIYDKIGENTFRRSWMGYYIDTTDGKDIKVDEERSVLIILNNNGYILEHYQGSESSPCCIHTFTKEN